MDSASRAQHSLENPGWSSQCTETTHLTHLHPPQTLVVSLVLQILPTWTHRTAAATPLHRASCDTVTVMPAAWGLGSLGLPAEPSWPTCPFRYSPYSNSQMNQTLEGSELIISLRCTSWHCTRGRKAWMGRTQPLTAHTFPCCNCGSVSGKR